MAALAAGLDGYGSCFALDALIGSIDSPDAFRAVVKVMLSDRKLSWGRVVIICEVAMALAHKNPRDKDEIMQVMIDACNISSGHWMKL